MDEMPARQLVRGRGLGLGEYTRRSGNIPESSGQRLFTAAGRHQKEIAMRYLRLAVLVGMAANHALLAQGIPKFELAAGPLEWSGSATSWRFVKAVGERSGLWGFENGRLEGWVYPLKVFRDFHLAFQLEGSPVIFTGDEIVRSVRVYPHMVQLQYAAEQFSVVQTLFAPRDKPGLAVLLDVRAPAAMRIFVRFRPELNLMWPAGLGGQTAAWDAAGKRIVLGEVSRRFSALIGSPMASGGTAVGYHSYVTEQQPYESIEIRVTPEEARRFYVPVVTTAGIRGIYDAAATYDEILRELPRLHQEAFRHYVDLDSKAPEFRTPDPEVNKALRWARLSLEQLKICNPYVGCSYVSGYGSSGTGTRPMYAWFFDEPTIASWALLDQGGAESVKNAFRFIRKFQRADGKVVHEVSQSAGLIDWFKDYPFGYIHPDSSLFYLIATEHLYRFTGDRQFLEESWPSVRKAYQYCLSIVDPKDGLLEIPAGEWGSTEMAGFRKDAAMAAEWIAALRAVREMSMAMGQQGIAEDCQKRERTAADSLEQRFWNPEMGFYNYGLDSAGKPLTHLNPMIGYGAWFGSLPDRRARDVVRRLVAATFLSDWGQRNISLTDARYTEGAYQSGSVWPFLTAGSLLAQYRLHNAAQGFLTWMSMVRLRSFQSRGAMPEVLSGGSLRALDNGVPHQMFSEHTVVPGFVQGILGLEPDVPRRVLRLGPHLPAAWPEISVSRFPYGNQSLSMDLRQAPGQWAAVVRLSPGEPVKIEASVALPSGAQVESVVRNGRPVPYEVENFGSDVHVKFQAVLEAETDLVVRYKGGVGIEVDWKPLLEGDPSRNLRVIDSAWNSPQFEATVEGRPQEGYTVRLHTTLRCSLVEGGALKEQHDNLVILEVAAPAALRANPDNAGYVRWIVRARLDNEGAGDGRVPGRR